MKTRKDPRHKLRVKRMKQLFTFSFDEKQTGEDQEFLQQISQHLPEIDKIIQDLAPEWPIERLNKIDLAILRLAIEELKFVKKTPEKVIIDEAIELGKEYGTDNTPKFINGVLGTLLKKP